MSAERDGARRQTEARETAAGSKRQPALDPANALALLTYPARLWLASRSRPHPNDLPAAVIHYLERHGDRHDALH